MALFVSKSARGGWARRAGDRELFLDARGHNSGHRFLGVIIQGVKISGRNNAVCNTQRFLGVIINSVT